MESREDRLATEQYWLDEELAEFRLAYGLDADELPDAWKQYPDTWILAKRLDRLTDDLVCYVRGGFESPIEDFSKRWKAVSDRILVDEMTVRMGRLREGLREHLPDDLKPANIGIGDDVKEHKKYEVRAEYFVKELIRLKLGVTAREWSFGRLIEVAKLGFAASSETSQAFLHQALTRYVCNAGDKMVAVPCRAVLEAELAHRFSENEVQRAGNAQSTRHVSLADYMTHAKRTGAFRDRAVERAAYDVKEAGDDAAHPGPNLSDAGEILAKLSFVLKALSATQR